MLSVQSFLQKTVFTKVGTQATVGKPHENLGTRAISGNGTQRLSLCAVCRVVTDGCDWRHSHGDSTGEECCTKFIHVGMYVVQMNRCVE